MAPSKRAQREAARAAGQGFGDLNADDLPETSLDEIDMGLFGNLGALTVGTGLVPTPNDDGTINLLNFKLTSVGLSGGEDASFDDWSKLGGILLNLEASIQWLLGDWINKGQKTWGEKYAEALDETDYGYQTLRDYAYIAGKYDLSIRNRQTSFSHHRLVAGEPDETRGLWLDYAAKTGIKLNDLKRERALLANYPIIKQRRFLETAIKAEMRLSAITEVKQLQKQLDGDKKGNWYDAHLRQRTKIKSEVDALPEVEREQFIETWIKFFNELRKR